jgi:hypothetical protein
VVEEVQVAQAEDIATALAAAVVVDILKSLWALRDL